MDSTLNIGCIAPIVFNPTFISTIQPNYLLDKSSNIVFYPMAVNPLNSISQDLQNRISDESNENQERKVTRTKFTPEEDEQLKKLVNKIGSRKWNKIAEFMPGRNGRQCRDRYQNYLIPGFYNCHWTKEEDATILQKYEEMGPQWSKMTVFFKNRNGNAIKNRWYYFVSKHINDINEYNIKKRATEKDKKKIGEIFDYDVYLTFKEMSQTNEKKSLKE